MIETKIFWLTNTVTEETKEESFYDLITKIQTASGVGQSEAEKILTELEEDEELYFKIGDIEYQLYMEIIFEQDENEEDDEEDEDEDYMEDNETEDDEEDTEITEIKEPEK